MFNNGRKTIGVFISHVNSEYQTILSKGISIRAQELDYNVALFTNFGGYGQSIYDMGELNIANLPDYSKFDGIIIAPDTMALEGLETTVRDNIAKKSKCPVVSVRRKIDEYYNVLIDDNSVLEEIIRHFIVVHGFNRINFLAGPKGFPDSDKRLDSYKKILSEYNIPIEEERIYYGDLWKAAAYDAVNLFLSSPLERPQAIICANDYMAITTCNALSDHDIRVPDDIAVSGCDDINDSVNYIPTITTAKMPVYNMGVAAVDKIYMHNQGIAQDNSSYMKTEAIYRESCGCRKEGTQNNNERRRSDIAMVETLLKAITMNAYMSTDLTGLSKLEEVDDKINQYVYENVGFSSFYMCLRENWTDFNGDKKVFTLQDTDNMIMEIGIKNRVGLDKVKFKKHETLPSIAAEDRPQIMYFASLHHQENCFGHVVISFEKLQTYMPSFQAWLINISNALENVRVQGELNRLVYELEDMYIRDALTGLYNRRGLEVLSQKYLKQCEEDQKRLMVFTADMDDLKLINDKYGHASGDRAIKVVADALQEAADDDEICMRCGGDEFTVVGMDYDEEKIDQFIKNFTYALDKFNLESGNDYEVSISYGWTLVIPDDKTEIEECMNVADAKMYQQKYRKKTLLYKAKR